MEFTAFKLHTHTRNHTYNRISQKPEFITKTCFHSLKLLFLTRMKLMLMLLFLVNVSLNILFTGHCTFHHFTSTCVNALYFSTVLPAIS